ncbi:FAD-dependent monooxygenase [Crocinitomix catalasitica]|uniref:FAD-dependent monooxygenase n=1 Tax=Crocinitomix catalasitica TaxID=184607 RepID=UPI000488DB3B|nr:FAD-dependent monooxygenase [Crocinitomix catalasitica]
MIDKNAQIAILGAGIGGLTTAIALHQKGFKNISIYERRDTASALGAGVVLWANASKILDRINLLSAIEKCGGKIKEMQRWTEKGAFLGAIDVKNINADIGSTSYAISRVDLQNILTTKVEELQLLIHYNHHVLQLIDHGKEIGISFQNQDEIHAEIVIGADGRMNSIARKYVNEINTPVYQNFVNWIGIIESDQPLFSANNVMDFWGCGERFGIVPINKYKGYWAGGKSLPLNAALKEEDNKEQLLEIFGHWSPKIKEVISLTADENIKYIEVYDQHPISKWYKNNVCLIGDAAHAALPTSEQGACQAIEDAWHFTSILSTSKTTADAFETFQKIRFQKTTTIAMAGRELAQSLFNTNEQFCKQRNENAMHTNYTTAAQNIAKLWAKDLPN